jgi:N,N'-diacetylchitobiose transport system permease protein
MNPRKILVTAIGMAIALVVAATEKQTLTIWLASFTTQHGTDWGGLMAGATLTALPVVVFFLLVQRHVAGGLTAGAVKG